MKWENIVPFGNGYYEADYGRFSSALVRPDESGELVCVGVANFAKVKAGLFYDEQKDCEMLEYFARKYDLPIEK